MKREKTKNILTKFGDKVTKYVKERERRKRGRKRGIRRKREREREGVNEK